MKKKQHHKSRKEILADLKKNKDFMEKMKFTKEVFYPALCKATKNIDDAQMFLGSIASIMMEIFLGFMKTKRLGELDLPSKLDPKADNYEELKTLLALFEDMDVFTAKTYFEGMRSEISLFLNEENKGRPLSDLKTKWVDELK